MRFEATVEELKIHGADEPIITHITIDETEVDVNNDGVSVVGLRYNDGLHQNLAIASKDLFILADIIMEKMHENNGN